MLRKLARIPILLAVAGAYLNTAQLLAEFQPDGSEWIAWLGAASIGLGLFLTVEALLQRFHWTLIFGIAYFGISELFGQILHAALVRGDVAVMTPALEWIMGYYAPSSVVLSGVVMAFIIHYGFVHEKVNEETPQLVTVDDLQNLEERIVRALPAPAQPQPVPLTDLLKAVQNVENPDSYLVDFQNRTLTRNGSATLPEIIPKQSA